MIDKSLVGKAVLLKPTGNYARISNSEPEEYIVKKVARVKITVHREDGSYEQELRFNKEDNHLDAGCNAGYLLFLNQDDYEVHLERLDNVKFISSFFGTYGGKCKWLTNDDLRDIKLIIENRWSK